MARQRKLNPGAPPAGEPGKQVRPEALRLPVEKIVSGGQTGVDRAALDFAVEHRIAHGGWCPRGRLAEDGLIHSSYQLKETPDADYAQRTGWNVCDSDGTVIFTISPELTGGSALTRMVAEELGKPCLHLSKAKHGAQAAKALRDFIRRHGIKTLNVAGPRLSTEPAAAAFARQVLEQLYQPRRPTGDRAR